MAAEPTVNAALSSIDPASGCDRITPSDATDLARFGRGVTVGADGDVTAMFEDGSTGVFYAVAGAVYAMKVRRVFATGTTASNITIWY